MATPTRLTLQDFLAMPETKPYKEYVRGEVVSKAMPNASHSALVTFLCAQLFNHLQISQEARVDTELRHLSIPDERVYLPDVSVTRLERWPSGAPNPITVHPDLAIEVLSPDDRAGDVLDKVALYPRIGVALTWLIDPERRIVTIYRRGEEPKVLQDDDTLDARPIISDFALLLSELFAVIPRD